MENIHYISSGILGLLIGWLIKSFHKQMKKRGGEMFTPDALKVMATLILGGGLVEVLGLLGQTNNNTFWFYPIGLLVGIIIHMLIDYFGNKKLRIIATSNSDKE